MSRPFFLTIVLTFAIFGFSRASILTCNESAVPPIVKGEGIAERTGDIALNCSGGAPGAIVDGNLSIFLNVNITNRLIGNAFTGVIFTIDAGSGPQLVNLTPTIGGPSELIYNGVHFALSTTGTATLRIQKSAPLPISWIYFLTIRSMRSSDSIRTWSRSPTAPSSWEHRCVDSTQDLEFAGMRAARLAAAGQSPQRRELSCVGCGIRLHTPD